jgi:RNA polymerase sigma-70 factor (ECF subfamily)
MIDEAESLLRRAGAMGAIGRFQLEAALQSAHVHRRLTGRENWAEVVQLYDALATLTGSPVVAINRALAIAEWKGVSFALAAMPELTAGSRLAEYQPYWAARAELLAKAGDCEQARQAYQIAIGLERDRAVRRYLERRQSRLRQPDSTPR